MRAVRHVQKHKAAVWQTSKRFQGGFVPADMPIVKRKWKSVDIVGKITLTMRNVAAGKLPSSEKFLSATRPFSGVTGPMFETENPPEGIKKRLHIVVGCERGLCGVVGANLPKILTKYVRGLKKTNPEIEHEVVICGKKTSSKIKATLAPEVTEGYIGMKTKMPTMAMCLDITDRILAREFEQATVYYNVYKNSTTFFPSQVELYNSEISKQIAGVQFPSYEIEGCEATTVQNLMEFKYASTLYNCMAEQLASEMGSRLASMDSASKNCKEKSKDYEQIYQRLRKTKITNELTVLSAGTKLAKKK